MKSIIIIPSRLQAVRLPRKPLALLAGEPMVLHVWRRAMESGAGDVVVACCSGEIKDVIEAASGTALITDPALPTGTDRVVAALKMAEAQGKNYDFVVNLQGDLPAVNPAFIAKALERLKAHPEFDIMTLVAPMTDPEDIQNPNIVKAVVSQKNPQDTFGNALYFSRSAIPHGATVYYHHIGIYVFRKSALEAFVKAPPSLLEGQERLEQLRALEMGLKIGAEIVDDIPQSVDVPEDLAKAEAGLKHR